MKFIKGFIVSIVLYLGLSLTFQFILMMLSGDPNASIGDLFADIGSISVLFYGYLAQPTLISAFAYLNLYLLDLSQMTILIAMIGSIVPVALAGIIGCFAEKSSGTAGTIFISAFAGLMVCGAVGALLQAYVWPAGGALGFPYWEWFIPSALVMSAINAIIWCSVGLFLTSRTWD